MYSSCLRFFTSVVDDDDGDGGEKSDFRKSTCS